MHRIVRSCSPATPSDAVIDLAKGAEVLVTEVTDTDDVIGLMQRNGAWQAKTESEQEGWQTTAPSAPSVVILG